MAGGRLGEGPLGARRTVFHVLLVEQHDGRSEPFGDLARPDAALPWRHLVQLRIAPVLAALVALMGWSRF